ncbi:hypothetical protein SAMN05443287_102660 [Micromonospora phaseoli]|uniref:Uncharacterized protein n=1 Tax=Micromonospora phaseoli TaxID=1144548 RepID=A0A1H6VSM3_9ACTN|nr:hypothetical protein [Micromonospora phaseoli]PZV93587.1 hypothetical protein CLV64_10946 [Micromonospora phaseoli]SEJ03035.1 hypothetical protein SAMN05443287_102660 [Micromonospora phaseoli]
MRSPAANAESRLSLWRQVREYAVPPSMIKDATARRRTGDWAGACAAARVDVDLNLRAVARQHGRQLAAVLRTDLRHLAPDLLRWHLPRVAPDGLLRPALTVSLARYPVSERDGAEPVHLVARTPPAWADAGQRFSLALWTGGRDDNHSPHPHSRPDRRFRLDLHRHLWDVRRADELASRSGVQPVPTADSPAPCWADLRARGYAVRQWAAEADLLLRAEGLTSGSVMVRLGARRRLVLDVAPAAANRSPSIRTARTGRAAPATLPVLPDAATWIPPDLELLRRGLIDVDQLHPLVASALVPGIQPTGSPADPVVAQPMVACGGGWHRIGLVDGVLTPLDHDRAEIHREELLAALTGTPLACLRAIDEAHRNPACLPDVRARLDHGDITGALAAVGALLGPDALLRDGNLRQELENAAQRRLAYGMFRAGLTGHAPPPSVRDWTAKRDCRSHPRHTTLR